ncbi:MAG: hypothetical protein ABIP50_02190 [Candidatus Saccharimonadales bacterium]
MRRTLEKKPEYKETVHFVVTFPVKVKYSERAWARMAKRSIDTLLMHPGVSLAPDSSVNLTIEKISEDEYTLDFTVMVLNTNHLLASNRYPMIRLVRLFQNRKGDPRIEAEWLGLAQ